MDQSEFLTFRCRRCNRQRKVARRFGRIMFEMHREPGTHFLCAGANEPLVDAVGLEDVPRVRAFIEKADAEHKPKRQEHKDAIQERFERYDKRNPQVYKWLIEKCRRLQRNGVTHYGIGALWEDIRYESRMNSGEVFKLPDNYRSRYVRKIIKEFPEFESMFELRKLRSK